MAAIEARQGSEHLAPLSSLSLLNTASSQLVAQQFHSRESSHGEVEKLGLGSWSWSQNPKKFTTLQA